MLLTKRRIVEQVDIYSGTIDSRDREKISRSIGYLFFLRASKLVLVHYKMTMSVCNHFAT
jgi:hypothetical protein